MLVVVVFVVVLGVVVTTVLSQSADILGLVYNYTWYRNNKKSGNSPKEAENPFLEVLESE
jgi:hypothetical protein